MDDKTLNIISSQYGKEKRYWMEMFSENTGFCSFTYLKSYKNKINNPEDLSFKITGECFNKIMKVTSASDNRLLILLTTAVAILLRRYSQLDNITIGTTILNQGKEGNFINTILPIRNEINETNTFKELLIKNQYIFKNAIEHVNYPIINLLRELEIDGAENCFPLFDVAVVLKNIQNEKYLNDINNNFTYLFERFENHIESKISYNRNIYSKEEIQSIIIHFENLLNVSLKNPNENIHKLDILSEEEKHQLLHEFNNTKADYPKNKSVCQLFEEQVIRTPGNIALSINSEKEYLVQLLESLTQEGISSDEYTEICFESNQLFFQYTDEIYKEFDIYNEDDIGCTVLIRNLKNELLILDKRVICLLQYFNSETNLMSIYKGLKVTDNDLRIVELYKKDNSTELNTAKQIFDILSFEGFMNMIYILYKYSLIAPVKLKKETEELHVNIECSDFKYVNSAKAVNKSDHSDKLLCEIKNQENILLLGDSSGESTVGLLYLASYLRKNGFKASCQWYNPVIANKVTEQYVSEIIAREQPTIVGISMKWFLHIQKVIEFSKLIKKINPSIRVILGGNTASYYCDSLIKFESIDYIILGDGELPLLKICLGENYIPNCVSNKDGEIKKNAIDYVQKKCQNSEIHLIKLNEIMISLKDLLHVNSFYINTGKGCSMQCFYCAGALDVQKQSFNRRKPFLRDVNQVRQDILLTKDYVPTLMFDFDTPLFDSIDYFRDIWKDIDLSNNNCEFYSWKLPSHDFIKLISETYKTIILHIDLASLSEKHRVKINQEGIMKLLPSNKEIMAFLDICKNYETVKVKINLISGLPFLSEDYLDESKEFSKFLMNHYPFISGLNWGRLHAQPGAPILSDLDKFKMHSYATTFEDFRHFSELNYKEKEYPNLEDAHYPYIYFNDDALNSLISKNYYDTNKLIDKIISSREKIISTEYSISYQSLNEKANQMAYCLQGKGVVSGCIVAILMDSSINMVISILGVMKSGGVYLPISTDYPKDRINYILQNSKTKVLITCNRYFKEYSGFIEETNIINVQSIKLNNYPSDKLVIKDDKFKSAYVIYTSGTTGKPKGVLVGHDAVVNTLIYRRNSYKMTELDRSLQLFPVSFDGFVTSFFTPLISGCEVVLLNNNEAKDISVINAIIFKKKITHFICVPALYKLILDFISEDEASSLKCVTVAGDQLPREIIEKTLEKNRYIEISHEYGVTEAAVMSTIFRHQEKDSMIKIGKPIANTQIFILDKNSGIMPINIPGELCISGVGLAKGYLDNSKLTKVKFVDHPFRDGERLYKTGDLARWLPNGNIEFLGRIDHQVKIRGFRIELGEIESVLQQYKGIKDCVVIVREENEDKYLCAYVVCKEEFNSEELRAYMLSQLPDYMVPSNFVELDILPLTTNGKVNRKALPSPEIKAGDDYVAPSNEIEEKLVELWCEVLNIEKDNISTTTNFFEVGGHSLNIISLNKKINYCFNTNIEVMEMFRLTTIKSLAIKICKDDNEDLITAISDDNIEESVDVMDEYLTFMEDPENE